MGSDTDFNEATNGTDVGQHYASRGAGKTVLITGVTLGGIGDATARGFAIGGAATIIITGRDDSKLSAAVKELSVTFPKTQFRPLKLDLTSLSAAKQAAQEILDDTSIPVIDILVTNAGIITGSNTRHLTVDGIESHFAVNHLSHFVIITTLLPKLRAAAKKNAFGETRIIPVSSGVSQVSPLRFSDWNYDGKELPADEQPNRQWLQTFGDTSDPLNFSFNVAYGQSKTANILTALHINKLFAKEGIYGFSLHPGFVSSNGAKRHLNSDIIPKDNLEKFGEPKTIDQGSATTLVAALDPEMTPDHFYLEDAQVALDKAAPHAKDEKAAEKLWKLSEDIVKEKLRN